MSSVCEVCNNSGLATLPIVWLKTLWRLTVDLVWEDSWNSPVLCLICSKCPLHLVPKYQECVCLHCQSYGDFVFMQIISLLFGCLAVVFPVLSSTVPFASLVLLIQQCHGHCLEFWSWSAGRLVNAEIKWVKYAEALLVACEKQEMAIDTQCSHGQIKV